MAEAQPVNPSPGPQEKKSRLGSRHPMLGVLVVANFRWLWIGQAVSVLGSQFYLIALTGILIKVHTLGLFLGAGSLMTIIVFLVAIRPKVRSMGLMEKQRSRPGPVRPA